MRTKLTSGILFGMAVSVMILVVSCTKETPASQILTISSASIEGTADQNGEYVLEGHISSKKPLSKLTLTRQGQPEPFLSDESGPRGKKEYDYSYLITGITQNTTILLDVYDQNNGMSGARFVIKKK